MINNPLDSKTPFLKRVNLPNYDLLELESVSVDNIVIGFVDDLNVDKIYDISVAYESGSIRLLDNAITSTKIDFTSLSSFDADTFSYDAVIEDRSGYEYGFTVLHTKDEDHFILQPKNLSALGFTQSKPDEALKSFIFHRIANDDFQAVQNMQAIYFMNNIAQEGDVEINVAPLATSQ